MKLYAYSLPTVAEKSGWLKIGETHGDVEKRVNQQGHELNLRTKIVWQDAVYTERSHIDKLIHQELVKQGFQIARFEESGADTEWVKCDVSDVIKAYAAVKEQLRKDEIERQAVTEKFYLEIRNWYYWTTEAAPDADYALRVIVRLLLCFFLRDKELVPKELFDENWIKENLKENEEYRYYNAVLRNLFFYSLNTPQNQRGELEHKKLVKNLTKLKDLFKQIPFLNGGLFTKHAGDDFSINDDYFFSEKRTRKLAALDDNKSYPVEGIVRILSKYEFKLTIDDLLDFGNAKIVDPEFIGKVFESLLVCVDADSKESRRKVTGSFYTPREIVSYMVNESLDEYLKTNDDLLQCRILDPACGSGAFPCGVMNEMMQRIDPDKTLSQTERYHKKLDILCNVIYGVDIQPMAVQIAVLRLFLSLIQDIRPSKDRKDNYGIEPLPNLETKFVCANTLIGLQTETSGQQRLKLPAKVRTIVDTVYATRNQHLMARDEQEKQRLVAFDATLRNMLGQTLETEGLSHDAAVRLAQWNPYDQTISSPVFDPLWMFGVENFDIVIGNPPYGATYPQEQKAYFLKHYESAKTTDIIEKNTVVGKLKGSLDTFSLFIENGFNTVKKDGLVMFIVPMSVVSSDSMTALHNILLQNCEKIKVSSYAKRPSQIFHDSCIATSILLLHKTETKCERLLTTKMNRLSKGTSIEKLVQRLQFVDVGKYGLDGRIPKISFRIEKSILKKLFAKKHTRISALLQDEGNAIYYRAAGGRYFNVVTNCSQDSTQEKRLLFDKKIADCIGAVLSSSLFWWYQQVYMDSLHIKSSELNSFPIPVAQLTPDIIRKIERLYARYLKDIERNVVEHTTTEYKHVTRYKEYKIRYSKPLIDEIDDLICPLYDLTDEETEFIKNYELAFRVDD